MVQPITLYLCGGFNKFQYNHELYHKPLNYIFGKRLFQYTLSPLAANSSPEHPVYIILHQELAQQNLPAEIHKSFPHAHFVFYTLPYITRGPIESAFLALQHFQFPPETPLVFFDNDVLYTKGALGWFYGKIGGGGIKGEGAVVYSGEIPHQQNHPFCYVQFDKDDDNNNTTAGTIRKLYEKRETGGDYACVGIYVFRCSHRIQSGIQEYLRLGHSGVLYFSHLINWLIQSQHAHFEGFCLPERPGMMGTPQQALRLFQENPQRFPSCRLCFDLDNTLVSYPTRPNDYTTCQPLPERIAFLQNCYTAGHHIILSTARRMRTHKGNVNAVLADIGALTFQQLRDFNIPYHEIHFGKPDADFYIDDKAINPYHPDWVSSMGFFHLNPNPKQLINQLPSNKHNQIIRLNEQCVQKRGATRYLSAQATYLKTIYERGELVEQAVYFPRLYDAYEDDGMTILEMEYVKGIPYYKLYQAGLMTTAILQKALDALDCFHSVALNGEELSWLEREVRKNWYDKLEERLRTESVYANWQERDSIVKPIMEKLREYCEGDRMKENCVGLIHGDFWFSNLIWQFNGRVKAIDPRGKVGAREYIGGDAWYDWAKLYQSLMGYDGIVHRGQDERGEEVCNARDLRAFFEGEFERRYGIGSVESLAWLTRGLILGTFPFIEGFNEEMREALCGLLVE